MSVGRFVSLSVISQFSQDDDGDDDDDDDDYACDTRKAKSSIF